MIEARCRQANERRTGNEGNNLIKLSQENKPPRDLFSCESLIIHFLFCIRLKEKVSKSSGSPLYEYNSFLSLT